MEFSNEDRCEAEQFCRDIAKIADDLERDPSALLKRSPYNPNLTRVVVYNLMLQREAARPLKVDPMRFALDLCFAHRGLYEGPRAVLEGSNEAFNQAFFGTTRHTWPLCCGWEHTWHIIGPERMYPELEFSPTREYCLMEDSKLFGTRARNNQVKTTTTKVVAVRCESCERDVIEQKTRREERISYYSHLPSGHNAWIYFDITSTGSSTVDYQVTIFTDEGIEGMGSKKWKPAREISAGQVFALILNKSARMIADVRAESVQNSPVDIWYRRAVDGQEIAAQLTSIEPPNLYAGLARGERLQLTYGRSELMAFVLEAYNRKNKHSATRVHLLLDCGFLIPASDAFEADVRALLKEKQVSYESVWLVSRLDQSARCVFGASPFKTSTKNGAGQRG